MEHTNDSDVFVLNKQRRYIKYHPDIHENQGKDFTISELEYVCKYYESDGARMVSYALGRTEQVINRKLREIRASGKYEFYKHLNLFW